MSIDDEFMTDQEAFAILGIRGRVTRAELQSAYIDSVRACRRGRFSTDPSVQCEAEAQLKLVTMAYELLSTKQVNQRSTRPENQTAGSISRTADPSASAPPPSPEPSAGLALFEEETSLAWPPAAPIRHRSAARTGDTPTSFIVKGLIGPAILMTSAAGVVWLLVVLVSWLLS